MTSGLNKADPHPLSDSESSDSRDEDGWSDAEEDEEETLEVISLLDDRVFPDVMSMLAHCKEKHGFNFLGIRQRLQLDFHGCVKLVNFIRQRVHEGLPVTEDILWSDIDQEQYLKPVLDDDAVILGLFDLPELTSAGSKAAQDGSDNAALVDDLLKRNNELQEELARAKAQFESYRLAVQQTLDERWGDVDQGQAEASSSAAKGGKSKEIAEKKEDDSKYYWESYAGADIHETMLKDAVRTDAYRDFIYNNKHLFAGKTVLDIGCGTGILSMFCARAGASKVIAVDASAIINKAQENVFHNGLSSVITCVHGKIEDVSLPVDEVDIIVSEWMGYCLLFEAMLPSVLYARDRYLKSDGLLVPSHANIWLAPVVDPQYVVDNIAFWRDIYGFDMHAMQTGIYDEARVLSWPLSSSSSSPLSTATPTGSFSTFSSSPYNESTTIPGPPSAFKLLDLYTTQTADLSFTAPFASELGRDIDALDGFLVWFDMFFSPRRDSPPANAGNGGSGEVDLAATAHEWASADPQNRVAFTTGPHGTETHWKQGLLLCKPDKKAGLVSEAKDNVTRASDEKKTVPGCMSKGTEIKGEITFSVPEDHARGLSIKVAWNGGRKQAWVLR